MSPTSEHQCTVHALGPASSCSRLEFQRLDDHTPATFDGAALETTSASRAYFLPCCQSSASSTLHHARLHRRLPAMTSNYIAHSYSDVSRRECQIHRACLHRSLPDESADYAGDHTHLRCRMIYIAKFIYHRHQAVQLRGDVQVHFNFCTDTLAQHRPSTDEAKASHHVRHRRGGHHQAGHRRGEGRPPV